MNIGEINATLLVQILNFIVAYIVLDRLLFRPVLALILKEESEMNALSSSLDKAQKALDALKAKKKTVWQSFQQFFTLHAPSAVPELSASESLPGIKEEKLVSKESFNQEVIHLADVIKKKVAHDA